MAFDFNKIYVIESLGFDRRTGHELYHSVVERFEHFHDIGTEFFELDNKEELISVLNQIALECDSSQIKPLIHLEIHGLEDKSGLALFEGSISWRELAYYFRRINKASNWNLNLTMAVCYGNYFLESLTPLEPSPVAGFIGSFEEIHPYDILLRFDEFYTTLRDTLSLDRAIEAMMNQNGQFVNGYAYIDARRIFSDVYNKYLSNEFSQEALLRRYLIAKGIDGNSIPLELADEFRGFVRLSLNERSRYFERNKRVFFMIDDFPDNEVRFPIALNEVI